MKRDLCRENEGLQNLCLSAKPNRHELKIPLDRFVYPDLTLITASICIAHQDWHMFCHVLSVRASPGSLSRPISARRNALGQYGPSSHGNCGEWGADGDQLSAAYGNINACDSPNPSLSAKGHHNVDSSGFMM